MTEELEDSPDFNPEEEGYIQLEKGKNEWVKLDTIHGGELWFTQEHEDKYGCGEEEIDWDDYRDEEGKIMENYQEDYDAGYRWKRYTIAIQDAEVVDNRGIVIREETDDDNMKANGMPPEAFHAEGCLLTGSWGEG